MVYRFVHSADIHLDSPLRSLALRDPDLRDVIGGATRRALEKIIDLCLDEQVDALLLAGDLYDGDQTSMKTARFFADQLFRLDQAGIKVFVIRGNHDALSKITKEFVFPEGVKLFGAKAEVVPVKPMGGRPIAIHGLSFKEPHAAESLLQKFKAPVEGSVNIGLMHTSLAGGEGHDPYAPCQMADLQASGFRYWALGHVHKRSVTTGNCTVVMPGIPQGRDIGEAGPKSVSLVTVHDDGSVDVEERVTNVAEFLRVKVDLQGVDNWASVVGIVRASIEAARESTRGAHLVARLDVGGVSSLAWRLRSDIDLLKGEADTIAERVGRTWIEKIEVNCAAPAVAGGVDLSGDPLVEFMASINEEIVSSEAFLAATAKLTEEFCKTLPRELRDMDQHKTQSQEFRALFSSDQQVFRGEIARMARAGAEEVVARLRAKTGSEDI